MKSLILKDHFNYTFISRIIRWHTNYYLFGRGTPINAGVLITEACNARCIMCNVWKKKKPSTYPRAHQEKAIDALAKSGCFYYSISGGEPTIVKDLPERLAYAARRIPYVRLTTNGLTMTPELARALNDSGIKEVGISIDGTDEYHNMVRGRPDAAKRVWNSLEFLLSHAPQVQIVINSVITPYNIQDLRELGKRLIKFPQVRQKYLPLTFHEIFGTEDEKLLPVQLEAASQTEIEKLLDEAILNPRIVNSSVFLEKIKLFFRGEHNVIPEQKKCLYAYYAMEFDSKGFAYPCGTGMNFKNGISPETDLAEYLASGEYNAMQNKMESCTKCQGSMMLCYYEPRLNFPLHVLYKYYRYKNS